MKQPLVYLLLLLMALPVQGQLTPQTKKETEKFFPEIDLEINTPAFQKKKGFTKYGEMMGFLDKLVKDHPQEMELQFIGASQKGKKIPMVLLSREGGEESKVKVWMQGGIHGNEPASTEGLLYLMEQLVKNEKYAKLLDRLEIAIVPMANIDGYEKQDRYAQNGLDLNRDQTKFTAPESIDLKQAFSDFGAEVAMDFHEYRPYRRDFARMSTYGITSRFDAMFLYSGNLNVPPNLRTFTKEVFVKDAEKALDAHQLAHHDYVSTTRHLGDIHFRQGSSSARSSATSYALTNAVSCLFEVRGVGIGRTSFKRRVFTTYLLGSSFLMTAYDKRDQVKKEIERANSSEGEAVVISERKMSQETIKAIDIDKTEEITLEVTVQDAWHAVPVLTRPRPSAYLILATEAKAIKNLKVLGLEMEVLAKAQKMTVETYQVSSYLKSPMKYEGVRRQEVTTFITQEERAFPAGTYLLKLDQPKANLAIEVLEPEGANSFVSFSVIQTANGDELPVYRLPKSLKQ
ncbi:MAG: M14 family zinc carboxypeptidase [Bacteroidota bacterium]